MEQNVSAARSAGDERRTDDRARARRRRRAGSCPYPCHRCAGRDGCPAHGDRRLVDRGADGRWHGRRHERQGNPRSRVGDRRPPRRSAQPPLAVTAGQPVGGRRKRPPLRPVQHRAGTESISARSCSSPLFELPIPLKVVVTDYYGQTERVCESGDLYKALAASCALPALFTPVKIDGRVMIDGGIYNPIPFDHLRDAADIVIAVDVVGGRMETAGRSRAASTACSAQASS